MTFSRRPHWRAGIANLPFALSLAVLLNLFGPYVSKSYLLAVVALTFIAGFFFRINTSLRQIIRTVPRLSYAVCGVIAPLFLYVCFRNIYSSTWITPIVRQLGIPHVLCSLLLTLTWSVLSLYSLLVLLLLLTVRRTPRDNGARRLSAPSQPQNRLVVWGVAAAVAAAVIGICSKSSPLYPFNDWVDANCFMSVGKAILHGDMPYLDLYEQKGPLLYLLHAVASLISDTSYIGVYLLETLAATAFLAISYRIVCLLVPRAGLWWMPVLAVLTYSSPAFCHGDSAEELCLPLLAYALYVGLRAIMRRSFPSHAEHFLIGVTSACVLWIKYSMLGFYIGWFLAFVIYGIATRRAVRIPGQVGMIAAGVVAASAPVLVWFAAKGALDDLWQVYFYDNLFMYTVNGQPGASVFAVFKSNLIFGCDRALLDGTPFMLLAILAIVDAATERDRPLTLLLFSSFLGLFALVYGGGQHNAYYALILALFAPVGLGALARMVGPVSPRPLREHRWAGRAVATAAAILICASAFVFCDNIYLMAYDKEDLPQYRFAAAIWEAEGASEGMPPDVTLLNYGFLDGGFYMAADIRPTERYFCKLNIENPVVMEAQNACIDAGAVDYVVTRDTELTGELYRCIEEAVFHFEDADYTYRLYRRIE